MNTQVLELPQELTAYEKHIFDLLDAAAGSFVSRTEIETALYGDNIKPSNCVQVFIRRMRKKGMLVETKRGRGYRLSPYNTYRPAVAAVAAAPVLPPSSIETTEQPQ